MPLLPQYYPVSQHWLPKLKCLLTQTGSLWTRLGSAPKTKEKNMKKVDPRAPGTEEDDSELQRAWGALIKEKEQSRQKKSRLDNLPSLQIEVSRESSSASEAESWCPLGPMAAALKPDVLVQSGAHSRTLPLQELAPVLLLLIQSPSALASSARHLKNVTCFEGHLSIYLLLQSYSSGPSILFPPPHKLYPLRKRQPSRFCRRFS